MCKFHPILIVCRHFTQELDLEALHELLDLVNGITKADKESLLGVFNELYDKFKFALDEEYMPKGSSASPNHICVQD